MTDTKAEDAALETSPLYSAVYMIRNYLVGDDENTRIAEDGDSGKVEEEYRNVPLDVLTAMESALLTGGYDAAIRLYSTYHLREATVEQVEKVAALMHRNLWNISGDESPEELAEIEESCRDGTIDVVATFREWCGK